MKKTATEDPLLHFFAAMDRDKLRKYRELNAMAVKGQTVCAGSSLMENFPINEMLMDLGSTKRVYNRGMSAYTIDRYAQVLDIVLDLEPSRLIINIGSNDLSLPGDTIENMIEKYRALLLRIRQALPRCAIVMLAFYPCREEASGYPDDGRIPRTMANVNLANRRVSELAQELGCTYLDCNAPLLDEEGFLRREFMTDPIHFSPNGYREVLKLLEPYL